MRIAPSTMDTRLPCLPSCAAVAGAQLRLARPQRPQIEAQPPLDVGEQRPLARRLQDGARIRALQPEPGLLRGEVLGVALHAQQRPAAQSVQAELLEQLAEALEHRREAARREPGQLVHQVEIAVQPGARP